LVRQNVLISLRRIFFKWMERILSTLKSFDEKITFGDRRSVFCVKFAETTSNRSVSANFSEKGRIGQCCASFAQTNVESVSFARDFLRKNVESVSFVWFL